MYYIIFIRKNIRIKIFYFIITQTFKLKPSNPYIKMIETKYIIIAIAIIAISFLFFSTRKNAGNGNGSGKCSANCKETCRMDETCEEACKEECSIKTKMETSL